MSARPEGRAISFFGDLHPSFAGNVVKAMASAKLGYPIINRKMASIEATAVAPGALVKTMNEGLRAAVQSVERLTPNIVEVTVRAPSRHVASSRGNSIAAEFRGFGAAHRWHDAHDGRLSAHRRFSRQGERPFVDDCAGNGRIVGSLRAFAAWRARHLDGPTGEPTETPPGETVLLVGAASATRSCSRLGRRFGQAVPRLSMLPAISVWSIDTRSKKLSARPMSSLVLGRSPGFEPTRPQDRTIVANIVEAIAAMAPVSSARRRSRLTRSIALSRSVPTA